MTFYIFDMQIFSFIFTFTFDSFVKTLGYFLPHFAVFGVFKFMFLISYRVFFLMLLSCNILSSVFFVSSSFVPLLNQLPHTLVNFPLVSSFPHITQRRNSSFPTLPEFPSAPIFPFPSISSFIPLSLPLLPSFSSRG